MWWKVIEKVVSAKIGNTTMNELMLPSCSFMADHILQ